MKNLLIKGLGLLLLMIGAAASAGAATVDKSQRQALAVTLYSNGLALIRDQRAVRLSKGNNTLEIYSVSPRMLADSVQVTAGADFEVLEQGLLPANLSREGLLKAFQGTTVQAIKIHPTTGAELSQDAEIISVEPQLILRIGGQIETAYPGRLIFPAIPDGLRAQPVFQVAGQNRSTADVELILSYLAEGLSWQADHIASFDDRAETLLLQTRATLENDSGLDLNDSQVHLIAGQVSRIPSTDGPPRRMALMAPQAMAMSAMSAEPTREAVGGFYLYRLPATLDLADGQRKQVALVAPLRVPAKRTLVSHHHAQVFARHSLTTPHHPEIRIELTNAPSQGHSQPIPAGVLRLYGTDNRGRAQFLGENQLPNLPAGETAKLTVGQAFDVTVRRKQTDFKRDIMDRNSFEAAFEIRVQNGGEREETVEVGENLNGDWELIEGAELFKRDGARAVWTVTVPPGGEATAAYRVRLRR